MQLPIFPYDSAPLTLTSSIWLGVLIAAFFNLRFGWTLSGLVIPGYLVPIFISRPLTGVVILIQAAITYGLVYCLSEWPRNQPYWSSFFGRDRFFMLLLASVLVRSVLDGWLLPLIGHTLVTQFDVHFDYRNNLNSFGLIAVALIANFLWKPGLMVGLVQTAICTSLCYLGVQLLVLSTNFTIGSFDALYADISLDLLKSPKCYIVLLTTAYIASQMNLKYSWDFNGIMIPSLMALVWTTPWILVTAVLESILILGIGSFLLQTPIFKKVTMEGGRKLGFFFTICFVYRFLLVHLAEQLGFQDSVGDYMGTGYLLSTLVAVKAHDKNILIRMVKGITEVSMLGAVVGSLIGFLFYCGPAIRFPGNIFQVLSAHEQAMVLPTHQSNASISEMLRRDKIALYDRMTDKQIDPESALELAIFHQAITCLKTARSVDELELIQEAQRHLRRIGYELLIAERRYFYLRERQPMTGRGLFVVDTRPSSSLAIEVPSPVAGWATLESGICLLQEFAASAIAITRIEDRKASASDQASYQSRSLFAEFQRVFAQEALLTITAAEGGEIFQVKTNGFDELPTLDSNSSIQTSRRPRISTLVVQGRLPDGLNLQRLRTLTSSFDVRWRSTYARSMLTRKSRNWAHLRLCEADRIRLVSHLAARDLSKGLENPTLGPREFNNYQIETESPNHAGESEHSDFVPIIEQPLDEWLVQQKKLISPQGSDQYVPATIEQIMFMDSEVVTPLLRVLNQLPAYADLDRQLHEDFEALATTESNTTRVSRVDWLNDQRLQQLTSIQSSATLLGYQISILQDSNDGESYVLLSEMPISRGGIRQTKGWGIYVFRPGLSEPFAVEVPRPLFERRSMDFGIHLFQRPRSAALLIAGAHPRANLDGTSDISKAANRTNLFNLVRHSLLDQLQDRPFLITQARAIQAPVDTDLVMATEDGTTEREQLTPLKRQLYEQLHSDQLSITFVDGSPETAGYELGILMQAMSVQISANKEIVSLWLSPALRSRFQEHANDLSLASQFEACQIQSTVANFESYFQDLVRSLPAIASVEPSGRFAASDRSLLADYVESMDVILLYEFQKRHTNWNLSRITDGQSGHSYLVIQTSPQSAPIALNLTGSLNTDAICYSTESDASVQEFVASGTRWLLPESTFGDEYNSTRTSIEIGVHQSNGKFRVEATQ